MTINTLLKYFLLFIMYAHLGWLMEVVLTLFTEKKLINRGFLIGPVCPIYGVGLLLIITLLKEYSTRPLVLFTLVIAICMILEYVTSYLMEKLFHARWWDYSQMKYNLNGRICLETTIPFGLGGLFVIYIVNPLFERLLSIINPQVMTIIAILIFIIFIIDIIISFSVISKMKNFFVKKYQDNTEVMSNRVREYLTKLSPLTKRLLDSFPNIRVKINDVTTKIKNTVQRIK